MMYQSKALNELGILTEHKSDIVDEKLISSYAEMLYQGLDLPSDIHFQIKGHILEDNQEQYAHLETLPPFVKKEPLQITDPLIIDDIEAYYKANYANLPDHVYEKRNGVDGVWVSSYYYDNQFGYYKDTFTFTIITPLSDNEIIEQITIKNTLAIDKMSSQVNFIYGFVIFLVIITIISFVIALASLAS